MKQTQERLLAERRERDLAGIRDPDSWPRWPLLPMKRWVDGQMQVGLLVDGQGPIIYLRGLYDTGPQLKDVPTMAYETIEAMLDDGWTVD